VSDDVWAAIIGAIGTVIAAVVGVVGLVLVAQWQRSQKSASKRGSTKANEAAAKAAPRPISAGSVKRLFAFALLALNFPVILGLVASAKLGVLRDATTSGTEKAILEGARHLVLGTGAGFTFVAEGVLLLIGALVMSYVRFRREEREREERERASASSPDKILLEGASRVPKEQASPEPAPAREKVPKPRTRAKGKAGD
jgi:Ca2+/Na+ antiporter